MPRPEPHRAPDVRRRALGALGLAALVSILALSSIWRCPLASLFHLPCPACGMTRASSALLRGEVSLAFRMHPLVFVAGPLLALVLPAELYWEVTRGPAQRPPWRRYTDPLFGALGLGAFALWLLRFAGALGGPVPV